MYKFFMGILGAIFFLIMSVVFIAFLYLVCSHYSTKGFKELSDYLTLIFAIVSLPFMSLLSFTYFVKELFPRHRFRFFRKIERIADYIGKHVMR